MSCHEERNRIPNESLTAGPGKSSANAVLTRTQRKIHLVGRPNVGKSTLFNLLTGAHQTTMNVPRTTVSVERGIWQLANGERVQVTDLPGTYSLFAQSPDEEVTTQAVAELAHECAEGDLAIVVLDATALSSSLYLLAQTVLTGVRVIAALSMNDLAASNGQIVDALKLSRTIGVPVVDINPRKGRGAHELASAILAYDRGAALDVTPENVGGAAIPLPESLTNCDRKAPEVDCTADATVHNAGLSDPEAELEKANALFAWVSAVSAELGMDGTAEATTSDKIDSALLRPIIGIPVFLAVLWATFQLTTTISGPIQDWFEGLISGPLTTAITAALTTLHAPAWLDSLVANGLLAGVGTVVSFLPLMVIIFTMIFILEDSGYLARVAVMADRGMQAIGLDGRAVLPLVIGFGCNIPALSATKTIQDSRQRLLTGLLIPYSSCTARLVIYLLLASAFFPNHGGTVVFCMYLASAVVILGVAWALRKTAFRRATREPLLIVLPTYQTPRLGALLRAVTVRCKGFVQRAGLVILGLSLAVWVLMAVPIDSNHSFGDIDMPVQSSLFGATATGLSPVFEPAGFDDWHVTSSLMTGFVAKEAVVGTLATTYGLDEPEEGAISTDLNSRLVESFEQSSGGHAGVAAVAFMVFCLVYTPCLVTVGEQKRLFGTKITAASVAGSIVFAWVLAIAIFQVGRLFW